MNKLTAFQMFYNQTLHFVADFRVRILLSFLYHTWGLELSQNLA